MGELLRIDRLCVTYPTFQLRDISFACSKGEIIGMIGVNGAGKSTTIKAIMQMVSHAGDIYWKDTRITSKSTSAFRECVGYVGDNDCYYPNIKVSKILGFVSALYSNWDNALMEKYLRLFNLDTNKKMKELSTGMRVKLDLVMAMSHHAELYILDEPTSGLDPVVRKEVLDILEELAKKEGKTVIISSHITSDLERIADRVLYLVDGELIIDENTEQVRADFSKRLAKDSAVATLEDVLFYLNAR